MQYRTPIYLGTCANTNLQVPNSQSKQQKAHGTTIDVSLLFPGIPRVYWSYLYLIGRFIPRNGKIILFLATYSPNDVFGKRTRRCPQKIESAAARRPRSNEECATPQYRAINLARTDFQIFRFSILGFSIFRFWMFRFSNLEFSISKFPTFIFSISDFQIYDFQIFRKSQQKIIC